MKSSPCKDCVVYAMCDTVCYKALDSLINDPFIREIRWRQAGRYDREQKEIFNAIGKKIVEEADKEVVAAIIDSYSANQKEDNNGPTV